MRLEQAKDQHFKNFNRTIDVPTLEQFLGNSMNHGVNKIFRLFPQNTLQMIIEQMNGVYNIKGASTESVEGMRYEWGIEGVPDFTTTFSQSITLDYNTGRNSQEFNVCLTEPIANENEILILENEQTLLVLANHETLSDGRYQYPVRLITNDPTNEAVNPEFLQIGRRVSSISGIEPEMSRIGYIKQRKNKEKRVNYLTKIRSGVEWSGEAAMAKFYVCPDDKNGNPTSTKAMVITEHERRCLEDLTMKKEFHSLFGESTVNPKNNQVMVTNRFGEKMIAGDGIIKQIDRDGHSDYYTRLTTGLLREIIGAVITKHSQKRLGDIKIVMMTGFEGMIEWDRAMREELKQYLITDNVFVTKQGEKIKLGAEFMSYTWLGATITVVRNPIFDNTTLIADRMMPNGRPSRSAMFLIMDVSTYDGKPNIQMLSRKDCNIISGDTLGFGGKDGKTSGSFSTPVHGSRHDVVGYTGIVCHIPETCMILRKSFV